ncbi:MAG: tRNA (adenosine(37)-N6)-threonylcarbamoyltransferase complex transferase subunit TsaD [Candidatus Pacebacteria bacterium]|nr:tRNA (adenosine(37)-N6)-threonylcarbamoyltransferase complex transferase subunit TsaD [Candidatus Paceibacterota bacterium]
MIILGIETSCDDTGISLMDESPEKVRILANSVSCQEKIHSPYGGVFPALAKREHQKNILPLLKKALKKANLLKKEEGSLDLSKIKKLENVLERYPDLLSEMKSFFSNYKKPEIDKIVVTVGPGLEPCLWVGINFARALSLYWEIDVIPVNHLEGHLLSNLLDQNPAIPFPSIGLIVSGGNTQIILIEKLGKYKVIGETRDDAAGECFDKTARLLGLGYPGGKKISELAKRFKESSFDIRLPRPMIHEKNLDFSFSGLKTAVLYETKKRKKEVLESAEYRIEIAKEIENAIVEVIAKKIEKSIERFDAKGIVVGGGVSANKKLRSDLKKLARTKRISITFPKIRYTGDNASMIAIVPHFSKNKKVVNWKSLRPNSNLKINGR